MAPDEQKFRLTLQDLKLSLNGIVLSSVNPAYELSLPAFFAPRWSVRNFLPEFLRNSIVLGTLPDPTFGGLTPGRNEEELNKLGRAKTVVLGRGRIIFGVGQVAFLSRFGRTRSEGFGLANNELILPFWGRSGYAYLIQLSEDLATWYDWGVVPGVDGPVQFADPTVAGTSQRFYRAIEYPIAQVRDYIAPPPNDYFYNAEPILQLGATYIGHNINASTETGESGRPATAWWLWTAPFSGTYRLSLEGSATCEYATIYTGNRLTNLTMVVSSPTSARSSDQIFNAVAGTTYRIAVGSYCGGGGIRLRMLALPSVAVTSPVGGTRFVTPPGVATNVTVTATVSGYGAYVSRVLIYGDNQFLAELRTPPYSCVWSSVGWGPHSIKAIAYDAFGSSDTAVSAFAVTGTASQEYTFRTLAGLPEAMESFDGNSADARLNNPLGVAVDAGGNLYIADANNSVIRKVTPAGITTTLAGLAGIQGGTDGTGGSARFNFPASIASDASGNIFVADTANNTIRRITPGGVVVTLAGSPGMSGTNDGNGASARFNGPRGITKDGADNLYVGDTFNHTIRKITPLGTVTTFAGLGGVSGSADGPGAIARFKNPRAVVADGSGNVYVADYSNKTIRRITPDGNVTTFAGLAGAYGSRDGQGNAARFGTPRGVALDVAGNLYVADLSDNTIRKVTPSGWVTTVAGLSSYLNYYSSAGNTDGTGSNARFNCPAGVALDTTGNLYVADSYNNAIRKISPTAMVTTLIGRSGSMGMADGKGAAARFNYPAGVAVDASGNTFVADSRNDSIRKIATDGTVTSFEYVSYPLGITVDGSGSLYVAGGDYSIFKITPAGGVSTLAGSWGESGSSDGPGSAARFGYPIGVAVDDSKNVYVADQDNHTIRKITPAGMVSTLAGLAGYAGSSDGSGSAARFYYPSGVAVDGARNVYVADQNNHTIRKITPSGVVSTLAGLAGTWGSADGYGSSAQFYYPFGVAVDRAGNVYVADTSNSTIRRITPGGAVSTLAGFPQTWASADGTGSAAHFNYPTGVAVDAAGNLYVADQYNHSIRFGSLTSLADSPSLTPTTAPVGTIRSLDTAPQTATAWNWSLIRRPSSSAAALSSNSVRNPSFTPDVRDAFVFRLTATNNTGGISIRTLTLPPEGIQ